MVGELHVLDCLCSLFHVLGPNVVLSILHTYDLFCIEHSEVKERRWGYVRLCGSRVACSAVLMFVFHVY